MLNLMIHQWISVLWDILSSSMLILSTDGMGNHTIEPHQPHLGARQSPQGAPSSLASEPMHSHGPDMLWAHHGRSNCHTWEPSWRSSVAWARRYAIGVSIGSFTFNCNIPQFQHWNVHVTWPYSQKKHQIAYDLPSTLGSVVIWIYH